MFQVFWSELEMSQVFFPLKWRDRVLCALLFLSSTDIFCSFDLGTYRGSHQTLSKDRCPEATDRQPTQLIRLLGRRELPLEKWWYLVLTSVEGVGGRQSGQGTRVQHTEETGDNAASHNRSHEPSDYRILLGYHRLQHPTEHSQQMTVYRLIVHNEFNKHYFMGSDITLLQLHLSVSFTSHILPACLPGPTTKLSLHSSCWITGWGMITEGDE